MSLDLIEQAEAVQRLARVHEAAAYLLPMLEWLDGTDVLAYADEYMRPGCAGEMAFGATMLRSALYGDEAP